MKHKDVERASSIVKSLTTIRAQLAYIVPPRRTQYLFVQPAGDSSTDQQVILPADAVEAAFQSWRKSLLSRRSELGRLAAQIGLNVDGLL